MEVNFCFAVHLIFFPHYVVTFEAVKLEPFEQDCLEAHNTYRAEHGVPPLTWSAELAEHAQTWADALASTDELKHDKIATSKNKEGENLAFFRPAAPKCQGVMVNNCVLCREMVKRWYDEGKYYDYDSGTANKPNVVLKHFAQLIWADTADVGIGTAVSKTYGFITVARYKPQGSKGGVAAYTRNIPPEGGPLPSLSTSPGTMENIEGSSFTPTGFGVPLPSIRHTLDKMVLNASHDKLNKTSMSSTAPAKLRTSTKISKHLDTNKIANEDVYSSTKAIRGSGVPLAKPPISSIARDLAVKTENINPSMMVSSHSTKHYSHMNEDLPKGGTNGLMALAMLLTHKKMNGINVNGNKGRSYGSKEDRRGLLQEANTDFDYGNNYVDSGMTSASKTLEEISINKKQSKEHIVKAKEYIGTSNNRYKTMVRTFEGPDGSNTHVYLTKNGAHAGIVFRDQISRVTPYAGASEGKDDETMTPTKRIIHVL